MTYILISFSDSISATSNRFRGKLYNNGPFESCRKCWMYIQTHEWMRFQVKLTWTVGPIAVDKNRYYAEIFSKSVDKNLRISITRRCFSLKVVLLLLLLSVSSLIDSCCCRVCTHNAHTHTPCMHCCRLFSYYKI